MSAAAARERRSCKVVALLRFESRSKQVPGRRLEIGPGSKWGFLTPFEKGPVRGQSKPTLSRNRPGGDRGRVEIEATVIDFFGPQTTVEPSTDTEDTRRDIEPPRWIRRIPGAPPSSRGHWGQVSWRRSSRFFSSSHDVSFRCRDNPEPRFPEALRNRKSIPQGFSRLGATRQLSNWKSG